MILQDHIQLLGYKGLDVNSEFLRTSDSLYWAAIPAQIRSLPESPP